MTTQLSIIIATYNSDKTLSATLDSLLIQTYKNFEVILMDGASNDNTISIIKEYENKFTELNINTYFSSEKDSGIYDAWNKALNKVSSNWIAFLGSDDTYLPYALETYIDEINKNPKINFISSKVELIDQNNNIIKIFGQPFNHHQMNRGMNIAHVGSFHHIDLFKKNGDFDTHYKIAGDYEFFLRCNNFIQPAYINRVLVRMLNSGVSNQHVGLVLKENLKLHLKYKRIPFLQSYFKFYLDHLKAFRRKMISK